MGTGREIVRHSGFELEEAEKAQEFLDSQKGRAGFLKLSVGKTLIRVLPTAAGKKYNYGPIKVVQEHFIDVPGMQGPLNFACPVAMAKEPCPACQKAQKLRASGNPADREAAYRMSPKMRGYVNVINRKEQERGPLIMPFGKTIFDQLIAIRRDEDAGGDYTDPRDGFDLIIERVGTGKEDTKYTVLPSRKASALGNDEWIDQQHDLDALARVRSYEEIKRSLMGEGHAPTASRAPAQAAAKPKGRTAEDDIEDAEFTDGDAF